MISSGENSVGSAGKCMRSDTAGPASCLCFSMSVTLLSSRLESTPMRPAFDIWETSNYGKWLPGQQDCRQGK